MHGYLALLLHAHLPFVRHPEHENFLEEDWLFEAVAETYIPLLKIFRRLAAEKVDFCITLTLTPTLCAMLRDPLLQERCARYMTRGVELAAAEMERMKGDSAIHDLAKFYHDRFTEAIWFYEKELKRDIVSAFAQLQEDGYVEIIGCAATHAYLPALESYPEAIRAQIRIGCDEYRECFGRAPVGIWLPECGYLQGLDTFLQEADIRWFVVDAHGLMYGTPRPRFAIYAPCFTPAGPAVFGRDRDSSKQVWSSQEGYPGDPAYRDFYRDIGQELPLDYLHRFGPELRHNTGIKYHRITGRNVSKEVYRRDWALGAADHHAGDFLRSRIGQIEHLKGMMGVDPLIMSPYDAELFGHWWFEGPEFLDLFIRKAAYDQKVFRLTTPTRYLATHPVAQMINPAASSWGHKGYGEVWLARENAWIYPHLHAATQRMIDGAKKYAGAPPPSAFEERMLRQMARELLLAQSSDWAFLIKTGTAKDYAKQRTKDHFLRFTRLHDELLSGAKSSSILEVCEQRDNLFPNINWRHFL
ncbi:MAG: 1,4-alpha-glucan branching protein domain-containing protein [Chthoniobacterales bacterium]